MVEEVDQHDQTHVFTDGSNDVSPFWIFTLMLVAQHRSQLLVLNPGAAVPMPSVEPMQSAAASVPRPTPHAQRLTRCRHLGKLHLFGNHAARLLINDAASVFAVCQWSHANWRENWAHCLTLHCVMRILHYMDNFQ